ncbi:MAG: hypothetical protein M1831_007489 [Alyxoria varia]|nr:MAG: hypothetical protein M1831_007489 [Alyxoria varia]
MKNIFTLFAALATFPFSHAHVLPQDDNVSDASPLVRRAPKSESHVAGTSLTEPNPFQTINRLVKRRGGGGGGRGGSSSGGGSSSSGSRGSSSGGGSSSSGSRGIGSSRRTWGGGYAGGAAAPFAAGRRTPRGSIAPFLIGGAALGAIGFAAVAVGGGELRRHGAYQYYYGDDEVDYRNQTSDREESARIRCICVRYQQCGCDDLDDEDDRTEQIESLIGDGSPQEMSRNGVTRVNNGTLFIDGTLPNGTEADTDDSDTSAGPAMKASLYGWFAFAVAVGSAVMLV